MRRPLIVLILAALASFSLAAITGSSGAIENNIVVPGTAGGPSNGGTAAVSTGIIIPAGAEVAVSASGTVFLGQPSIFPNDPDGGNPGNSTVNSLVPSSPYGCLAARVGTGPWTCLGANGVLAGPGEIQFAVNDDFVSPGVGYEDNSGQFDVVVYSPSQSVTIRKVVTGTDPGVDFPVTVTCTETPNLIQDVGTAAADGEMVLDHGDTKAVIVEIPGGGSKTVDVWWSVNQVENVTCTVSESVAGLPAGATCTPTISPTNTVVLYDVSSEIDQSGSFAITNNCAVAAVAVTPTFTG